MTSFWRRFRSSEHRSLEDLGGGNERPETPIRSILRPPRSRSAGLSSPYPSGVDNSGMTNRSQQNFNYIRDSRDRDRRDLGGQNDRFAKYVEKVRLLEAQNRILKGCIQLLKMAVIDNTSKVRESYEAEIKSLRYVIEAEHEKQKDFGKQATEFQRQINDNERLWLDGNDKHQTNRENLRRDFKHLSDLEADVAFTKRCIADCESEKIRIQSINSRLTKEINEVKAKALSQRIDREAANAQINESYRKMQACIVDHERTIREETLKLCGDSTPTNREVFRKELEASIRDIRLDYDKAMIKCTNEFEQMLKKRIEKIKRENSDTALAQNNMRDEIIRQRAEIASFREKLADLEGRNTQLEQMIEYRASMYREEERLFQISLNAKEDLIRKVRVECDKISLELDRILDYNISLQREINEYRELLDDGETGRMPRSRSQSPERWTKYKVYEPMSIRVPSPPPYYPSSYSPYHSPRSPRRSPRYYSSYGIGESTIYSPRSNSADYTWRSNTYKNYRDEVFEKPRSRSQSPLRETYSAYRTEALASPRCARAYRGHLAISHSSDGQNIAIENTSLIHEVNIGSWKVEHIVNGVTDVMFVFPSSEIILKPKQTRRIWGRSYRHFASLYDFVCESQPSFGIGSETQTIVYNQYGEVVCTIKSE